MGVTEFKKDFGRFLFSVSVATTLVFIPQSVDSQLSLSAISQSDSASSTQSLTHGGVPELLVGLSYNATTGRMSVELIKGSHFRNLAMNRPPGLQGASLTHTHKQSNYIHLVHVFTVYMQKHPAKLKWHS